MSQQILFSIYYVPGMTISSEEIAINRKQKTKPNSEEDSGSVL